MNEERVTLQIKNSEAHGPIRHGVTFSGPSPSIPKVFENKMGVIMTSGSTGRSGRVSNVCCGSAGSSSVTLMMCKQDNGSS